MNTCLQQFTIVAEVDKQIVAIAQLEDIGPINSFYCHPDFRRQGIARQLYAAIEAHAQQMDIQTIFTETNARHLPFYLK